jgi:hypothetical protein
MKGFLRAFRSSADHSSDADGDDDSESLPPPLPLNLQLGKITMIESANVGEWVLEKSSLFGEITRLQQKVATLTSRVDELKQRNTRITEEKMLVEFKNQLLTDLLATAQARTHVVVACDRSSCSR